jgi:transposase
MEEEATVRGAAKRFEVSVACAVRIGQRQRAGHGQVPGKIARHRCPLLAGEAGGWLLARLVDEPDLTTRALTADRRTFGHYHQIVLLRPR